MNVSPIVKRSVMVKGKKTSVSLEREFWNAVKSLAHAEQMTVSDLIAPIADEPHHNLSSALRLYVLGEAMKGRIAA
jgi:predicted DNA-binding ribbon-helix-helix protein